VRIYQTEKKLEKNEVQGGPERGVAEGDNWLLSKRFEHKKKKMGNGTGQSVAYPGTWGWNP